MTPEQISEYMSTTKDKTSYIEQVVTFLKGQVVEVYMGEAYEVIKLDQSESQSPQVFIGKVVDGSGDCLVLQTLNVNEANKISCDKLIFIQGYNIYSISPVTDHSVLNDILFKSTDLHKVLKHLNG